MRSVGSLSVHKQRFISHFEHELDTQDRTQLTVSIHLSFEVYIYKIYIVSKIMFDLYHRARVNVPCEQEEVRDRKQDNGPIDENAPIHGLGSDRNGQWEECKNVDNQDKCDCS